MIAPSRGAVIAVVATVVGGAPQEHPDAEAPGQTLWTLTDGSGREWKVEDDESISDDPGERAELVTPILTPPDLPVLERIVEGLEKLGARATDRCGVHVHVGALEAKIEHLLQLIQIVATLEPTVIDGMLGLPDSRRPYAALMSPAFLDAIKRSPPKTIRELLVLYHGDDDEERFQDRYDPSRFRGLNLHSFAFRRTIEFRYFNGSVEAKRICEYVRLCLSTADLAGIPK